MVSGQQKVLCLIPSDVDNQGELGVGPVSVPLIGQESLTDVFC